MLNPQPGRAHIERALDVLERFVQQGKLEETALTLYNATVTCKMVVDFQKFCCLQAGANLSSCRCFYNAVGQVDCEIQDIFDFKPAKGRSQKYNYLATIFQLFAHGVSEPKVRGKISYTHWHNQLKCGRIPWPGKPVTM